MASNSRAAKFPGSQDEPIQPHAPASLAPPATFKHMRMRSWGANVAAEVSPDVRSIASSGNNSSISINTAMMSLGPFPNVARDDAGNNAPASVGANSKAAQSGISGTGASAKTAGNTTSQRLSAHYAPQVSSSVTDNERLEAGNTITDPNESVLLDGGVNDAPQPNATAASTSLSPTNKSKLAHARTSSMPQPQISHTRSKVMSSDAGSNSIQSSGSTTQSALVRAKLAASAQVAPGGVLAHEKWHILEDGKDVDIDAASQIWQGVLEPSKDGQPRRFIIDLEALPKGEIKRQEIIHELITTEREYVRDLKLLIELFLRSMRQMNILSEEGLQIVFSNTEEILELNKRFLEKLITRKSRDFGIIQEISDILLDTTEDFRIYNKYCSNHAMAMEYLRTQKLNRDVGIFLQFCALKPECRGMDLTSFLLKPVQRVCKYPLLVRELIKHTHERHTDYVFVHEAFKELSDVVDYVNESSRRVEQQQRMVALINRLEFSDTLVLPRDSDRVLVCEGVLVKSGPKATSIKMMSAQRWCVLFHDCLVVAKPSMFSGAKAQVNAIYSIWSLSMSAVTESDRTKNVLEFNIEGKKQMQFAAASEKEKKMWLDGVALAMQIATKSLKNDKERKRNRAMESTLAIDEAARQHAGGGGSGSAIDQANSNSVVAASGSIMPSGSTPSQQSKETDVIPPKSRRRTHADKVHHPQGVSTGASAGNDVVSDDDEIPQMQPSSSLQKSKSRESVANKVDTSGTHTSLNDQNTKMTRSRSRSVIKHESGGASAAAMITSVAAATSIAARTGFLTVNEPVVRSRRGSAASVEQSATRPMGRSQSSTMLHEEDIIRRKSSRRAGKNTPRTNLVASNSIKDGIGIGGSMSCDSLVQSVPTLLSGQDQRAGSSAASRSPSSKPAVTEGSAPVSNQSQIQLKDDASSSQSRQLSARRRKNSNAMSRSTPNNLLPSKDSAGLLLPTGPASGEMGTSPNVSSRRPSASYQASILASDSPQNTQRRSSNANVSMQQHSATASHGMPISEASNSNDRLNSTNSAPPTNLPRRISNFDISKPFAILANSSSPQTTKPTLTMKDTEKLQKAMAEVRAKFTQNTGIVLASASTLTAPVLAARSNASPETSAIVTASPNTGNARKSHSVASSGGSSATATTNATKPTPSSLAPQTRSSSQKALGESTSTSQTGSKTLLQVKDASVSTAAATTPATTNATSKSTRPPSHTISETSGPKSRVEIPTTTVQTGDIMSPGGTGRYSTLATPISSPMSPTIQALIRTLTRDRTRDDVTVDQNSSGGVTHRNIPGTNTDECPAQRSTNAYATTGATPITNAATPVNTSTNGNIMRAALIKDKIAELEYNGQFKSSRSRIPSEDVTAASHAPVRPSLVKQTGAYGVSSSGLQSQSSSLSFAPMPPSTPLPPSSSSHSSSTAATTHATPRSVSYTTSAAAPASASTSSHTHTPRTNHSVTNLLAVNSSLAPNGTPETQRKRSQSSLDNLKPAVAVSPQIRPV